MERYEEIFNEYKSRLVFISFYVLLFENLISTLKKYSKFPYVDATIPTVGFDFVVASDKISVYDKEVFHATDNGKKLDRTLSLFYWAKNFELITEQDYQTIQVLRNLRNNYVHEMDRVVFDTVIEQNERKALNDLIHIRIKINNRWHKFTEDIEIKDGEIANLLDRVLLELYSFLKDDLE
ncbi:MAG: hypothetical protein IJY24_03915 [Clostridia bacterium]|nr:hypothetical protein [Clostridia bacterium]